MRVVCDSSILITLSLIDQLHLLSDLFGRVLIPPGVFDEVVRIGAGRAGADAVRNASFISIVGLDDPDSAADYIDPLGRVDAELLALARERGADLILTRDRNLQRRARREGLRFAALFDLFISAKDRGLIQAVKPLLDEMRNKGVSIRQGVYQERLREAGEAQS